MHEQPIFHKFCADANSAFFFAKTSQNTIVNRGHTLSPKRDKAL